MKDDKKTGASILFFAYLIVTLSYVQTLPFGSVKFLGVLLTICFPLGQVAVRGWHIARRDFMLFFILAMSALFQDTSVKQKMFSFFFYTVLICWTLHGHEIIKSTKHIFAAGMGIVLGIIVGLAYSKGELLVQLSGLYNSRARLWGAFTHPNHLGAAATAAIIAMTCYFVLSGWKKRRIVPILLMGLMILTLLETKSRTALIMVITFFTIYRMQFMKKLSSSMRPIVWILLIILAGWIAYSFFTGYAQEDAAYSARLNIFDTMIVTPKTFLVGNGMVDAASLNRENAAGGSMEIGWVMLFYKNGVIGLIAYVYIIGHMIARIKRISSLKQRWLAWAVLGSMMIGTFGEAYIVNITNISPMLEWILLGALTFKEEGFEDD